jgi:hypothetical protein
MATNLRRIRPAVGTIGMLGLGARSVRSEFVFAWGSDAHGERSNALLGPGSKQSRGAPSAAARWTYGRTTPGASREASGLNERRHPRSFPPPAHAGAGARATGLR